MDHFNACISNGILKLASALKLKPTNTTKYKKPAEPLSVSESSQLPSHILDDMVMQNYVFPGSWRNTPSFPCQNLVCCCEENKFVFQTTKTYESGITVYYIPQTAMLLCQNIGKWQQGFCGGRSRFDGTTYIICALCGWYVFCALNCCIWYILFPSILLDQ